MLAVVEVVIFAALVVIEADELPLEGNLILDLVVEDICAKYDLVFGGDECPLDVFVAEYGFNVFVWFQVEIVRQQTI